MTTDTDLTPLEQLASAVLDEHPALRDLAVKTEVAMLWAKRRTQTAEAAGQRKAAWRGQGALEVYNHQIEAIYAALGEAEACSTNLLIRIRQVAYRRALTIFQARLAEIGKEG